MSERIAILGGTFDPIHIGHLAIAEDARWALQADRVLFVPTAQQPLKYVRHRATAEQRLAMVELAVADNPCFAVSDLEIRRGGLSYSVDTVAAIKEQHPAADLVFVLGVDAVELLPRWHQIERLIDLCRFAVLLRPGFDLSLDSLFTTLPMLRGRMMIIDGPAFEISATDIRLRLQTGQPVRYHLPPAVWYYIEQHGLYRSHEQ